MREDMTLNELQAYFKKVFEERGFGGQSAGDEMLLLIEEVGELAKAIRKQGKLGIDYSRLEQYDSVESEIADVMIVLISLCDVLGIDLFGAIKDKEEINKRSWRRRIICSRSGAGKRRTSAARCLRRFRSRDKIQIT